MADAVERTHEQRGYRITGRVQGVGFRWWTRRAAEELGIRGTVRNLYDGSVEVHAAGSREGLEEFEGTLTRGPSSARIERVERIDSVGALPEDGFRIVF